MINIKVGTRVVDADGNCGVIVKVEPAAGDFHGAVYVWQEARTTYGDDNCEHYDPASINDFLKELE